MTNLTSCIACRVFVLGTFVHASEIGPSLDKKAVNNVSISSEMTSKLAEKESDRHALQLHVEKAMQLSSLKEFYSQGQQKILNLFNLLQTNPDLQVINGISSFCSSFPSCIFTLAMSIFHVSIPSIDFLIHVCHTKLFYSTYLYHLAFYESSDF